MIGSMVACIFRIPLFWVPVTFRVRQPVAELREATRHLRRAAIRYLHFIAGLPVPTAEARVTETMAGLKHGAMTTGMDRGVHPTRLKQLGRHKTYAVLDTYLEFGDPFESRPLADVM
jgi:hypothetical protein